MAKNDRVLNITNGTYFNEFFLSKFGGTAFPFCETMMEGDALTDIYSDEFIALRARELKVSVPKYQSKMYVYDALNADEYAELCLWFGKDTFCQTNLLTLLAYLEKINYSGKITLNYIDDATFEILERDIWVELGAYTRLYNTILVAKQPLPEMGVLYSKAFALYFDYRSEQGALSRLIMENADKERTQLICLLMENSAEYGLSVSQAEKLINSIIKD